MLEIHSLSKSYDKGKSFALKNVSFNLNEGDVCALVGESGSGKTTLVRLIAGLETPDAGNIVLNGEMFSSLHNFVPPEKRKVGLVFQEYALFPHMTLFKNVLYGISRQKNKKIRAQEVLDLVGLGEMKERYPHQLSGGQQQRVALARALAPNPSLLILDEPFSNLDAMLRAQLRNEIFEIVKKTGVTAIFVTHDTQDALAVADEILILQKGELIQKDEAANLYIKPNSIYVASLFGNTIHLSQELQSAFKCPLNPKCSHAIRHENFAINEECEHVTHARVIKRTFLGNKTQLLLKLDSGQNLAVFTKDGNVADRIKIGFNSTDVLEFNN
ncbi:ABC transporter ATP-binding protein [Salinimicrobium terrae]|uniref:ABC transporter ATP-binding protein n=1 Tax=Salinimicrobium terrae TaxID=470866 RepID=UPI0004038677|nr:ABC transporter ATP-binding protein [Salinimicrobium terrae]